MFYISYLPSICIGSFYHPPNLLGNFNLTRPESITTHSAGSTYYVLHGPCVPLRRLVRTPTDKFTLTQVELIAVDLNFTAIELIPIYCTR